MTISLGQKIAWDDLSRGFHGGYFESNEIETFNFTDEIQRLRFTETFLASLILN